ncbi:hypothetical protein UVI_02005540 [Ustilaginoidea virens]|uniref:Uncharacterized protein n=1 Tax=Ustilaginoidea virens TaxID=1159556 RepID=A0A1B5KV17_USTVR|nr:hypothetical protein UVI_02005540 [Ustilaginoidea virens]
MPQLLLRQGKYSLERPALVAQHYVRMGAELASVKAAPVRKERRTPLLDAVSPDGCSRILAREGVAN